MLLTALGLLGFSPLQLLLLLMIQKTALLHFPQFLANLLIVVYVYNELVVVRSVQTVVESLALDLLPCLEHYEVFVLTTILLHKAKARPIFFKGRIMR